MCRLNRFSEALRSGLSQNPAAMVDVLSRVGYSPRVLSAADPRLLRQMMDHHATRFAESTNGGTNAWRRPGNANDYGQLVPGSRGFPAGGGGGRRTPRDQTSGDASLFDDDVSGSSTSWDRTRDGDKVAMSEDQMTLAERNQMLDFLVNATGMNRDILSTMNDLQLWSLYQGYANPDDSASNDSSYSSASSVPDLDRTQAAMIAKERRRQKYDESHTVVTTQPNRPAPPRQMQAQHYSERTRQEGYAAGKKGSTSPCPYRDDPDRADWLAGFQDGWKYAGWGDEHKPRWATSGTTPSVRGAVAGFAEVPLAVRKFSERNARALASAGVDYVGNFLAADAAGRRQMLADCQRHAG